MSILHPRQRRMVNGYLDMGRITIPPLPVHIILTDRDDGTLWHLSYTLTPPAVDGYGYITLNSDIPTDPMRRIFDAYDGPVLADSPQVKLMVRGGNLGYDGSELPVWLHDRDQARIFARIQNLVALREIVLGTTWRSVPDVIAWSPYTVT